MSEKRKQKREARREEKFVERMNKRLAADEINGIYIPKNLEDCFVRLDLQLKEKAKEEAKKMSKLEITGRGHFGIGMWMRNNWGLWKGSRLSIYFRERGIRDPDGMTGIILFFYVDWLNGDHSGWREWENNPRQNFELKLGL